MTVNLLKHCNTTLNLRSLTSLQKCCYSRKVQKILGDIQVEEVPIFETEPKYTQEEIDKIRNKSRLNPQHRNMLYDEAPYDGSHATHHDRVGYRRKMLGRYGLNAPNVNPKWCWPTKEEVEDLKEYERVMYPDTIQEGWKKIEEKNTKEALEIKQREEEIDKVVANFDTWRANLKAKLEKKEAELLKAKERKQALLEEIREQFGFKIDPKDERYLEALAAKEKEDKKRKKEERKKKRQEILLARLAKQDEASKIKSTATDENVSSDSKNDDKVKIEDQNADADSKKTE